MYILSGKGTVAGVDLATYVLKKSQERGILWDNDLPEYTLDFLTQTPSVSKSIREGKSDEVVEIFNRKLASAQAGHRRYMLLCLTAHRLIPKLHTTLKCVNLWHEVFRRIEGSTDKVAFIGTLECLPTDKGRFVTLPNHSEKIGDLITSVKRGYAQLGESYAAHPKHLLRTILDHYLAIGVRTFFLACTDLHLCKEYLIELGIPDNDIIDILEIAGEEVLSTNRQRYETAFLDDVSDARTYLRYKYLNHSDSLHGDDKTKHFHRLIENLQTPESDIINILDIGGSSTGHSVTVARAFEPRKCHITLQDISATSINAAKSRYIGLPNITASFECCDITAFHSGRKYDVVLCLGILLCISSDVEFRRAVFNISDMMATGGVVITRDCLTDTEEKIYMAFGGVIRNEFNYVSVFHDAGFEIMEENSFIIEQPIFRKIKSAIWKKI